MEASRLTITACGVRLSDRLDCCDVGAEICERVGNEVVIDHPLTVVYSGVVVEDLTYEEQYKGYEALYAVWKHTTGATDG